MSKRRPPRSVFMQATRDDRIGKVHMLGNAARSSRDPDDGQTLGSELRLAEQVPAVCDVLATIERRDWSRLERLLHAEVHWTTAIEEHLHGPEEVIALLKGDPPPAPPAFHEVRDGLIVRWIDTPG